MPIPPCRRRVTTVLYQQPHERGCPYPREFLHLALYPRVLIFSDYRQEQHPSLSDGDPAGPFCHFRRGSTLFPSRTSRTRGKSCVPVKCGGGHTTAAVDRASHHCRERNTTPRPRIVCRAIHRRGRHLGALRSRTREQRSDQR